MVSGVFFSFFYTDFANLLRICSCPTVVSGSLPFLILKFYISKSTARSDVGLSKPARRDCYWTFPKIRHPKTLRRKVIKKNKLKILVFFWQKSRPNWLASITLADCEYLYWNWWESNPFLQLIVLKAFHFFFGRDSAENLSFCNISTCKASKYLSWFNSLV